MRSSRLIIRQLLIFVLSLTPATLIEAVSLEELTCNLRPLLCSINSSRRLVSGEKYFVSATRPPLPKNFDSWGLYGLEPGNGYGPPGGPGYGPGMGDVAIQTGVGVATPIGRLGIQRGFGLGFGGSGRIGGQPIGFGNGFGQTGNGRYAPIDGWSAK
ncbi:unnamed protein product, partial [Mesorhabditis spiculigera]